MLQSLLKQHLNTYHCLLIVKKGEGMLRADAYSIGFGEKELVFVPMGSIVQSVGMSGSIYIISFMPKLYCTTLLARSNSGDGTIKKFILKGKEHSFIANLFSITFKSFMTSPARKLEMFFFVCNFILQRKAAFAGRKDILFNQFAELAALNCHKEHGVNYYADTLYITKGYLEKIVRNKSGKTPKAFLIGLLCNKAIVLLSDTTDTVEHIAEQLGFKEASAFSTLFKRCTGYSPTAFRQDNVNKNL